MSIRFKNFRRCIGHGQAASLANGTQLANVNGERSEAMKVKANVKAGTAVEYAVQLALIIVVCITATGK